MLPLALALSLLPDPFARDNLVAWCVVPFDKAKRSPEDRAAMLAKLGFKRFAYDWRAEHLPTFGREVTALAANGVGLSAVWFPGGFTPDNRTLVARLRGPTQLWVMLPDPPGDQAAKVTAAADFARTVADEAAKAGHTVGLYNHGGWPGQPENLAAVVKAAGRPNVGVVYNLHHAHDHLDRLPAALNLLKPHLHCLNLNGTATDGERTGRKILPIGQGDRDREVIAAIRASGYGGPVGVIGHTDDDAEARLRDNLAGLDWLLSGNGRKPLPTTLPPPRVSAVTPSGPVPSNLLRLYVRFNTPMTRGEAADRLAVIGPDGKLVADALLDPGEELWSADGTGLTVLLHPGRVKAGIASSPGPVLDEGKTYRLRVAAGWPDEHGRPAPGFEAEMKVGPAVREAIDPARWQVSATPDGVRLTFDRPLDAAVVARLLTVPGVHGTGEATDAGRGWRFTPVRPFPPGEYAITATLGLEDHCGNRVGRPFESAPGVDEKPVRVAFRVR